MNKNLKIIKDLKYLLEKEHQVSDVEMTAGNYDESGNLIEGEIPTITTNFCEIGSYSDICYFTFILYSDSFDENLFKGIKNYNNCHIYGLKNFLVDYYPKAGISFAELKRKIGEEEYFQVQFNFRFSSTGRSLDDYLTISELIEKSGAKVYNQLNGNPNLI